MTLSRRLFLGAALAAPAIVRAESLMKLWVPPQRILAVNPFGTQGLILSPKIASIRDEMLAQLQERMGLLNTMMAAGVIQRAEGVQSVVFRRPN